MEVLFYLWTYFLSLDIFLYLGRKPSVPLLGGLFIHWLPLRFGNCDLDDYSNDDGNVEDHTKNDGDDNYDIEDGFSPQDVLDRGERSPDLQEPDKLKSTGTEN